MAILLKCGDTFSGCEILSRCGKGATGITYLAKNPIGQKIVIKIVSSSGGSERELRGLRNYMQIADQHPNLLHIYHVGEIEGGFFYTMEAADDCSTNCEYKPATLGNLLKRYKCFTPEEAIEITRELLAALKIIHDAKLIHRDIKPENIIFVDGKAKLSDPGLVIKVGETVSLAGTLGFISPEVINGDHEFDQQCDLYALGKVFYCMVTGFHPKQYPQLPVDMRIAVCRQIYPALLKMCNKNPEKRFKTAEEFLNGLPKKLEKPTAWEKIRQDFQDWCQCNRELFRLFSVFCIVLFLLLAGGALFWKIWNDQQQDLKRLWKKSAEDFMNINCGRKELTGFQIKTYFPDRYDEYLKLNERLKKAYQSQLWQKSAEAGKELDKFLKKTAAAAMPVIPEKSRSFQDGWRISGNAHGFLTTPLAAYADNKMLADFKKKLARHDAVLFRYWSGPRCGGEWNNMQFYSYPMVFVPPGAFRMTHSGKIVRIPYHYWICKHETRHDTVAQILGIAPQFSNISSTPVERICWNDILFYCFRVTCNFRESGVLPPGYIVRPPTEAEWEFASKNGWLGADSTPFEERARFLKNSQKHTWPSGSRLANKLGLWDMFGNVAEVCVPVTKNKMQNSQIIRGGSFLSSNEKDCLSRTPYLSMQFIPYTVGFRIVIAPGTMDFFDKHFFISGPQQIRHSGKVYELVGSISGTFTWQKAEQFSRLLGGRLAEFATAAQRDHVIGEFPLASSWPAFAGGMMKNGKWIWNHSKKAVSFGKWIPSRSGKKGPYMSVQGKNFISVNNMKLPIFLCEWDEKDYDKRNRHLYSGKKLPLELLRFKYGRRDFILINSGINWSGAFRACELLGGRLAVLDTPALRNFVRKKLRGFEDLSILTGGYAKRDKWLWVNGNEVDFFIKKDKVSAIPSRNRNFLTIKNGEFYNSQWSAAFLLELESNSASSH